MVTLNYLQGWVRLSWTAQETVQARLWIVVGKTFGLHIQALVEHSRRQCRIAAAATLCEHKCKELCWAAFALQGFWLTSAGLLVHKALHSTEKIACLERSLGLVVLRNRFNGLGSRQTGYFVSHHFPSTALRLQY
jgi:uncharacterized protein (DUF1697 family)